MEITLNQEQIQEAIQKNATQAVVNALCGYKVQSAIGETITEEVANGAVLEAIRDALLSVDKSALTTKLAEEMQKAVTSAVVSIVEEGLIEVVCRIRGVDRYGTDAPMRERVRAELSASRKP